MTLSISGSGIGGERDGNKFITFFTGETTCRHANPDRILLVLTYGLRHVAGNAFGCGEHP